MNDPLSNVGETSVIQILLVENSPFEAQQLKASLSNCALKTSVTWVQRIQSACEALGSGQFDAVVLDLVMPGLDAQETLMTVASAAQNLPIIVLSPVEEKERATQFLACGAHDYLVKGHYDGELLGRALRYSIDKVKADQLMRRTIIERKMEEENVRKVALLEQREQFVSLLAHDLKTPLTGCERILSMLLAGSVGNLTVAQVDLLSKMRSSNQSVLLMIENVLDVYHMDTNVQTLEFRRVQFSSLIDDCVQEMRPLSNHKRLKVVSTVPESIKVVVDQVAIKRVINNLLSNAIKFTPDGGKIEISATEQEGKVLFNITDTGVGMSPEHLEKLFQRIWQPPSGYKAQGLGLGLHLANKLIEAHYGSISCRSEQGRGTTIEVSLPKSPMAQVKSKLAAVKPMEMNFNIS